MQSLMGLDGFDFGTETIHWNTENQSPMFFVSFDNKTGRSPICHGINHSKLPQFEEAGRRHQLWSFFFAFSSLSKSETRVLLTFFNASFLIGMSACLYSGLFSGCNVSFLKSSPNPLLQLSRWLVPPFVRAWPRSYGSWFHREIVRAVLHMF